MTKKESMALKLPFELGETLCTWRVPGLNDETLDVPGLLSLEAGKYPSGILYGELPIKWVNGLAGFPQRHAFESLVGRLASGGSVALMNGELNYWFESQGRAVGGFAVLSRDELDAATPRKYQAIELQIEGLDAIMGQAPISQVQMPKDSSADPVWSATINRGARTEWEIDCEKMSVRYNASIRALDFYEFRMVFGSVVRISTPEGLTAAEWWADWVWPLRQLVSLLTQGSREIHAFLAIEDAEQRNASRDQVFGWDISQSTQNASRDQVREMQSLVNLSEDGASLLALLKRWQSLANARHPLLETYGSMATVAKQHPRSQVLLLLQALEGLYGFETREQRDENVAAFQCKREQVLERIAESSPSPADLKFLNKNLMKWPQSGLLDALASIFNSLPVDIRPELDATTLLAEVRASDSSLTKERPERLLVKVRNDLSHGSVSYDPRDLQEVADLLERIARAETLRVIDGPAASRVRALEKPQQ